MTAQGISHCSHGHRGNASRMPGQELLVVGAQHPVPQEQLLCYF